MSEHQYQCLLSIETAGPYATGLGAEIDKALLLVRASDRPVILHFMGEFVSRAEIQAALEGWAQSYACAGYQPLFVAPSGSLIEQIHDDLRHSFMGRLLECAYRIVAERISFVVGHPQSRSGTCTFSLDTGLSASRLRELDMLPPNAFQALTADWQGTETEWMVYARSLNARDLRAALSVTDPQLVADAEQLDAWARDRRPHVQCRVTAPEGLIQELTRGIGQDRSPESMAIEHIGLKSLFVAARVFRRWRQRDGRELRALVAEEFLRDLPIGTSGRTCRESLRDKLACLFLSNEGRALAAELTKGRLAGVVAQGLCVEGLHSYAGHLARVGEDLRGTRIVLVAPTVSFERLAGTLDLARAQPENVRILGLNDPAERGDCFHATAYPHSVLYLSSGIFESQADFAYAGMARFHALSPVAETAWNAHLRGHFSDAWEWHPLPPGNPPSHHSEWHTHVATRESIIGFIRGGRDGLA